MKDASLSEPIICGHCGNRTPMRIVHSHSQVETLDDDYGVEGGDVYELLECSTCRKIGLRQYGYFSEDPSGESRVFTLLYPTASAGPSNLPDEIQKELDAADAVRRISPNAYVVLTGRLLEKICSNHGTTHHTLNENLQELGEKGVIPDRLVKAAHGIRTLRNIGAHASLGEVTELDVPLVESLCRAILEYVYTAPGLLQEVETRVKSLTAKKRTASTPS